MGGTPRFLAAAMLCAALAASATLLRAETPDDQLVIGTTMNNILSLDPAFHTGRESQEVLSNVYDTLLSADPVEKGKLLPSLAESWSVSEDGRRISLTLRQDAKFHSGNPVTANDFVWSVQRAMLQNATTSTPWKSYGFTSENIESAVTAPDDYSVEINIPVETDPRMVLLLLASNSAGMVVERAVAEQHASGDDMGNGWLTTHDAGSGPFTLQNWQPNNIIILERFDDYWGDVAKIRRAIYRHMPEGQTQRLAIEGGDIDVAMNLSVSDIHALEDNPDIEITSTPGGNVYYLAVNMKLDRYANNKVREALRYLIDYEGINNTIMPYYGTLHQRNISKGVAAAMPDPGYSLDPEKAKALLAEAGYPDGFDANIRVLAEPPFLDAATAIQATLAEGGINAEIISGNGDAVYSKMRERDFDMIVGRGGGGGDHPHSNLLSQLYNPDNSDEAKLTSYQGWRTGFYSAELNDMIDAALLEKDAEAQIQKYHDILDFVDKEFPASIQPFSQAVDSVAFRGDVKDYVYHYAWMTRLNEVSKAR